MAHKTSSERLAEALDLARRQRRARVAEGTPPVATTSSRPHLTIAVSREAGANGQGIARAVGARLGWSVYDRELVSLLAEQMGVQPGMLEEMDEKHASWLRECLESLTASGSVSQSGFVRRLVETILRLATQGDCVIVGRGAAQVLPPGTTLRVRLIAPRPERVAVVQQRLGLNHEEADRWVGKTDHERSAFVKEHFQKDPANPLGYDLILNSARYAVEGAAELIVEALHRLQTGQTSPSSLLPLP